MPELFLRCAGRAPSGAAGWIWQTSAAPWGTFDCSNKVVGTGMSHARRTAGMGAAGCCSGIRMQRIVATYMQQSVAAAALRPKGQPVECKGYFCIYFWMLRHSVVRSMLRSRAARVRFPPHARRAANSLPFSLSGMMPYAASEGKGAVVAVCPRGPPLGCLAYFSIYFCSLRHSVVRSMPSLRAAWVRFPPHARRAANSLPFSPSGMVPYAASGGKGLLLPSAPEGTHLDV